MLSCWRTPPRSTATFGPPTPAAFVFVNVHEFSWVVLEVTLIAPPYLPAVLFEKVTDRVSKSQFRFKFFGPLPAVFS